MALLDDARQVMRVQRLSYRTWETYLAMVPLAVRQSLRDQAAWHER